jgi:hypothetical protein
VPGLRILEMRMMADRNEATSLVGAAMQRRNLPGGRSLGITLAGYGDASRPKRGSS